MHADSGPEIHDAGLVEGPGHILNELQGGVLGRVEPFANQGDGCSFLGTWVEGRCGLEDVCVGWASCEFEVKFCLVKNFLK